MNYKERILVINKKHETVKDYYDKVAIGYLHTRWFKKIENFFDYALIKRALEEELMQGRKVGEILEIGCGPGVWTDLFACFCKRVTAIDVSQKMINEARKSIKNKNIKFICDDFMKHDFNQLFNIIVSVRCIEYVQNKQAFVKKCCSLLKPYGKLIIVTKNPRSIWLIRQLYSFFVRKVCIPLRCGTSKRTINFAKIDTGTISLSKLYSVFLDANFSDIKMKLLVFRLPLVPLKASLLNPLAKLNNVLSNSTVFLPLSESYLISGIKAALECNQTNTERNLNES